MSSSERKKTKKQKLPPKKLNLSVPSLPDDLLLSCFARVSRFYYPTLSLVSKNFRSLIASSELYKTRSLLGHTESCLYVCLESSARCHWFTLCRKPYKTLTDRYVLATMPFLDFHSKRFSGLATVGSDVYNIGYGSSYTNPRPSPITDMDHEWNLDCRFHVTIHKGVVCYNYDEGKWDESKWDLAQQRIKKSFSVHSFCEIENVLYAFCDKVGFRWYDTEANTWKYLNGLVGVALPKMHPGVRVRLADYGGKMMVLWEKRLGEEKMFWCAEIALERRNGCQIWGKVEWLKHVLTVPIRYDCVRVLVVTV